MDTNLIFAYTFGGILILVSIILLIKPIKWILKIALNSALGAILLIAFNFIGKFFGVTIGVNIITALTVGILGLPGLALLLILLVI